MNLADYRFKPELWPSLFMAASIALLLSLGFWQLDRLEQKEALIARVEAHIHGAPIVLPQDLSRLEELEFTKTSISGHFMHAKEMHFVARAHHMANGYNILTPFILTDGRAVLVNRGFVPRDKYDPVTRPEGQVEGVVTLEGVIRKPLKGNNFTPENAPDKNVWFKEDTAQAGEYAGINLLPVVISLVGDPPAGGLPIPVGDEFRLRNDHLGYALTWFGLALVGAVMYVIFSLKREHQA